MKALPRSLRLDGRRLRSRRLEIADLGGGVWRAVLRSISAANVLESAVAFERVWRFSFFAPLTNEEALRFPDQQSDHQGDR